MYSTGHPPVPRAKQAMRRGARGISVRIETSLCSSVLSQRGDVMGWLALGQQRKGKEECLCSVSEKGDREV